jgi:universal stress protein E
MSAIRRILHAVKDTDQRAAPAVEKAAALARACGARLELFHAVSTPLFLPTQSLASADLEALKRDTIDLLQCRLEKLAAAARRRRIAVTCSVAWDHPPHEAILRRADETGADLIVAQCPGGTRRGALMRLTDWELLRNSERPVLLIRDPRPYRRSLVLAAVDPAHAHAKPADLDAAILSSAQTVAHALRGALHVVFANHPSPVGLSYGNPLLGAFPTGLTYDDLRQQQRIAFDELMSGSAVPDKRRHVHNGDAADVIPRAARDLDAQIVVMGAVSRSGLERLFIGNTAERVLTRLPCDVLVVKPAAFEKRVAPERRGAIVLAPTAAVVRAS